MKIQPVVLFQNSGNYGQLPFQKRDNISSQNNEKSNNTSLKLVYATAGVGLLAACGIIAHKMLKKHYIEEDIGKICDEVYQQIMSRKKTPVLKMPEKMPLGLPASVNRYSPMSISQQIEQYRANAAVFTNRPALPAGSRGTLQVSSLEDFHRWENAAVRLTNVTKQAPSDTYKSFKTCLKAFQERYGLRKDEIGFVKESMNMFADRIRMAVRAKEAIDLRILNKKITPEQLFAEKISSAFLPPMETDNAKVLQKLFTTVSETINF